MKTCGILLLSLAAAGLVACTIHQTEQPPLAGPSELALSITLTATPDSINQDGASQSSIAVTARDPNGRPVVGQALRMDMAVNGTLQDYGVLSARTIVTGSDGRAVTVYTAPPAPPPGAGGGSTFVSIRATPTGTNASTANPQTVEIRLVPTGVILPPAGTPTASFVFTPTPVTQGTAVTFDASASVAGQNAASITSYAWTFGDGGTASGKVVTHAFSTAATFTVTLTVTNDRSLSASTSQQVQVATVTVPIASFVFSPTSPAVGQTVIFNADQSTAAPGHQLTTFNWNFGDGATATGFTASHVYTSAGTFNVVLSVLDDLGQKGTTAKNVAIVVGAGGGTGLTAAFTFSPTNPGIAAGTNTVFFDASTSTVNAPATITTYDWDFGDGSSAANGGKTVSHTYTKAATYVVRVTLTDSTGVTNTTTRNVTIAP